MVKIDPKLESVCKLVTQCRTDGEKSNFEFFTQKGQNKIFEPQAAAVAADLLKC